MDTIYKKERVEDKYVLSQKEYERVLPIVQKNLEKFSYLDDGNPPEYTTVKSTYLDSYDLVMFKKHIGDEDNRSKVRIREYSPDGVPGNEQYIEIKEKKQGNDSKSRIRLNSANLELIKQGTKIVFDDKLKKMNESMKEFDLRAIMGRLNTLVTGYAMKPSISVTYTREAYQKGPIRITFDTDVKFRRLGFTSKDEAQRIKDRIDWDRAKELADRCNSDDVVMEVKHIRSGAKAPSWLTSMLKDNNLEPHGFSKYVKACVSSIKFLLASGGNE